MTTDNTRPLAHVPTAFVVTDGVTLFYPQGTGRVRTITLHGLAECDGPADWTAHTRVETVSDMVLGGDAGDDSLHSRSLVPVDPKAPPVKWTNVAASFGFVAEFADSLDLWLDWCDEQEAAEEEAVGIGAAAGVSVLGSKVQRAAELMTGGLGFSAIARLAVQHFDALDHDDLLADDCEASGLPGLIKEIHDALNREADERADAE